MPPTKTRVRTRRPARSAPQGQPGRRGPAPVAGPDIVGQDRGRWWTPGGVTWHVLGGDAELLARSEPHRASREHAQADLGPWRSTSTPTLCPAAPRPPGPPGRRAVGVRVPWLMLSLATSSPAATARRAAPGSRSGPQRADDLRSAAHARCLPPESGLARHRSAWRRTNSRQTNRYYSTVRGRTMRCGPAAQGSPN